MRISDRSSDVCSSDLDELGALLRAAYAIGDDAPLKLMLSQDKVAEAARALAYHRYLQRVRMQRIETLSAGLAELERDRKSDGEGESVSVRVDHGGRRTIKKNIQTKMQENIIIK